ncbi:MAG TPA: hypothetical protein IAB03_08565, partial [Candidatus Gallibacteroides avistercoris]|nr:hypothetical protein [Candidatus Gallibacteroides avistercoris]
GFPSGAISTNENIPNSSGENTFEPLEDCSEQDVVVKPKGKEAPKITELERKSRLFIHVLFKVKRNKENNILIK